MFPSDKVALYGTSSSGSSFCGGELETDGLIERMERIIRKQCSALATMTTLDARFKSFPCSMVASAVLYVARRSIGLMGPDLWPRVLTEMTRYESLDILAIVKLIDTASSEISSWVAGENAPLTASANRDSSLSEGRSYMNTLTHEDAYRTPSKENVRPALSASHYESSYSATSSSNPTGQLVSAASSAINDEVIPSMNDDSLDASISTESHGSSQIASHLYRNDVCEPIEDSLLSDSIVSVSIGIESEMPHVTTFEDFNGGNRAMSSVNNGATTSSGGRYAIAAPVISTSLSNTDGSDIPSPDSISYQMDGSALLAKSAASKHAAAVRDRASLIGSSSISLLR